MQIQPYSGKSQYWEDLTIHLTRLTRLKNIIIKGSKKEREREQFITNNRAPTKWFVVSITSHDEIVVRNS